VGLEGAFSGGSGASARVTNGKKTAVFLGFAHESLIE
jgi:hypothetical protein